MITPIIMEENVVEVERKLAILRENGERRVHFDIGDGMLTDWFGIAPADLQGQNLENLEIDFHLLVEDPVEWIEECVALSPRRIIGQIERMGSQEFFVNAIKNYDAKIGVGLALMIDTPVEELEKEILPKTAVVLLLAVKAGTSGSKFDERVVEKVKELRKIYDGSILVDGGINSETQLLVIEAGANEVAENSFYWKGQYEKKNI